MKITKTNLKRFIGFFSLLAVFALASVTVRADGDNQRGDGDILPPELPGVCGSIQVEAGNEAAVHVYAIGVQIYHWDGSAWTFVAPMANLYADDGYRGRVGFHYAGPTWESNSGS